MLNWSDVTHLAGTGNPSPDRIITKSTEEWKRLLTAEQYRITRLKGTEHAHSSSMCNLFVPGLYACACCGTVLFDSTSKFPSQTGWPSFAQPVKPNVIAYHDDNAHGMRRIETTCNACEAHLGHVFPDGPAPSGLRYCINALSLVILEQGPVETL